MTDKKDKQTESEGPSQEEAAQTTTVNEKDSGLKKDRKEQEQKKDETEEEAATDDQASASEDSPLPEEPPHSEDSRPSEAPAQKTAFAKRSSFRFLLLLLLIAWAVIAGLVWWGQEQARQLDEHLSRLDQQLATKPDQQQLERLHASLDNLTRLRSNQEAQDARLDRYRQDLNNYHQQVNELKEEVLQVVEPRPNDWQLAEAEYLLRLASQRLHLEEDIRGALTLFKTAEQRLGSAEVPGTLSIRQALQEDIAKLESLKKVDRVSLALQLQGLADQALQLPLRSLGQAPALNRDAATLSADGQQPWYAKFWEEMKSLVVITKRNLPVEPLPFNEEEQALKQQLSSLLQQAAWAALNNEEALYQQSLEAAQKRLQLFDAELASNQQFLDQIQSLQAVSITQPIPAVEKSLDRLQMFIAERYSRPLPVPTAEEAE